MLNYIILGLVALVVVPAFIKTIRKFSGYGKKNNKDHNCGGDCGCGCC